MYMFAFMYKYMRCWFGCLGLVGSVTGSSFSSFITPTWGPYPLMLGSVTMCLLTMVGVVVVGRGIA